MLSFCSLSLSLRALLSHLHAFAALYFIQQISFRNFETVTKTRYEMLITHEIDFAFSFFFSRYDD